MLGSGGDALERQVRKLEKERDIDPAVKMVRLRELFSRCARTVPSELLEEFFLRLTETTGRSGDDGEERFFDRLYGAADLFVLDYDDREDPLLLEDWKLIGELVSDYGSDIDDESLTYVMSRVVDHGAL
ncbi:hypothetical protein [Sediminispirochaeta smaragdinae]|jgi:hypothetical protein|uniref:Uncharacterized protein n=1 Tax=Sediminispirochaeta smaragdinae (strain DSM 11293 / JCM 15392 / SEBR 4228) TaxID=573413 RepID=E1RB88_SEDSS|nr:hypothetical protein [Sediminispirochaeta smaragdinae]ADK79618.1 hypothetical protein Spirs_0471 [Sediminispirochaeta smaragdinae DSM 11293]